jgi:hypothetical protein
VEDKKQGRKKHVSEENLFFLELLDARSFSGALCCPLHVLLRHCMYLVSLCMGMHPVC